MKKSEKEETQLLQISKKVEYKLTAERINYYLAIFQKLLSLRFFNKIKLYRIR